MESTLPASVLPASPPPPKPRGSGDILALANGVLAGISGVYVSTRSALITVVAALTAIALAATVVFLSRLPAHLALGVRKLDDSPHTWAGSGTFYM